MKKIIFFLIFIQTVLVSSQEWDAFYTHTFLNVVNEGEFENKDDYLEYLKKLNQKKNFVDENGVKHNFLTLYAEREDERFNTLFVSNNTSDSILLNDLFGVKLITEARNSDGEWVPITFITIPNCFVGEGDDYLKPNGMSNLLVRRYSGDFETLVRFNILIGNKTYYSNEFVDLINKKALDLENYFDYSSKFKGICIGEEVDKAAFLYNIPYAFDFRIKYLRFLHKRKKLDRDRRKK